MENNPIKKKSREELIDYLYRRSAYWEGECRALSAIIEQLRLERIGWAVVKQQPMPDLSQYNNVLQFRPRNGSGA